MEIGEHQIWFVNEQKCTKSLKVLNLFIGDDIKSFESLKG